MPSSVREILGRGGLASEVVEGWDAREAQLAMADAIEQTLARGGALAVEAPTGVGKTLAYLVPALLSGKKVIVSTNTKTLQDQIVDKDLPLLARIMERLGRTRHGSAGAVTGCLIRASDLGPEPRVRGELRYAVMKGRANYLCLDRLDKKRQQLSLDLSEDSDLLEEVAAWSERTMVGDRAELAGLPERSPLWGELDARAEICHGARCPRFDECFVVRMRRAAQDADVVIVNHHLLLADLALRAEASLAGEGRAFGEVVPLGDALILDEAHALEEVATEYFGARVSSRKLETLVRDIGEWLAASRSDRSPGSSLDLSFARAFARTEDIFRALPRVEGRTRLTRNRSGIEEVLSHAGEALGLLAELATGIEEEGKGQVTAESLSRRVLLLKDALGFVLEAADPDYVYWTERQRNAAALGASPIHVADLLSKHLFAVFGAGREADVEREAREEDGGCFPGAVIMTSATLDTGEARCRYFLGAIGAPEDTRSIVLDSPFDFSSQAALYLPDDAPDPDAPGAVLALVRIGKSLIDLVGGGALFLFTSHRMMREVHAQLSLSLDFPVMMQGERPQRELLRMFVDRAPAVLFATASFWEGVDVPGDPLRLVLIDRLPFGSPQDPLVSARAERVEALGGSAFSDLFVPRAILRLKQGFGRLIRGHEDRGVVAILDRRVRTRGYGKRFLRALPAAKEVHDLEALAHWLGADLSRGRRVARV